VNHKRVHRLWREEGLQRPTPRKQKRARPADGSIRRHQAEHPHQVWAMGFQFDATADGRRLKFLNVIEEHSRLCLAIRVGRRCKAKDVVAVLEELTSLYPAPTFIRSDNGPEFIAHALRLWCKSSGTATAYIEPGSPWQNGFAESFNSRVRDEFLNTELFATVAEAQGWLIVGAGSTTTSGPIRPSRGVSPWRQLKQLLHNHPLSLRLDQ
jgi:putative transposase